MGIRDENLAVSLGFRFKGVKVRFEYLEGYYDGDVGIIKKAIIDSLNAK